MRFRVLFVYTSKASNRSTSKYYLYSWTCIPNGCLLCLYLFPQFSTQGTSCLLRLPTDWYLPCKNLKIQLISCFLFHEAVKFIVPYGLLSYLHLRTQKITFCISFRINSICSAMWFEGLRFIPILFTKTKYNQIFQITIPTSRNCVSILI